MHNKNTTCEKILHLEFQQLHIKQTCKCTCAYKDKLIAGKSSALTPISNVYSVDIE